MVSFVDAENNCGVPVYIVEEHHYVLALWAELRRRSDLPLTLITLDAHTDTHMPASDILEQLMNYTDEQSFFNMIPQLKNDQHIQTALQAGILEYAFVICPHENENRPLSVEEKKYLHRVSHIDRIKELSARKHLSNDKKEQAEFKKRIAEIYADRDAAKREGPPLPPYTYEPAEDRIYRPGYDRCLNFQVMPAGLDDEEYKANNALESSLFSTIFDAIGEMTQSAGLFDTLFEQNLILDIDLDYFRTKKSLSPDDSGQFHELIRNATAITIAKEPEYVSEGWLGDRPRELNDWVLDRLLEHIRMARCSM